MNPLTLDAIVRSFLLILPEAALCLGACALFLGATWKQSRTVWAAVTLAVLGLAQVLVFLTPEQGFQSVEQARAALYGAPVWVDSFALIVKTVAILGGVVLVLLGWHEVPDEVSGEYYGCLLTIVAGVCFTGAANELVVLFLALELISIPTYILLYLPRTDTPAQEAALKYFLLSIFSSGLLLFGLSYLYGLTGTTNIRGVMDALAGADASPTHGTPGMLIVALFMVVAGLGFRITAVPFHYYAADVYQGTTTSSAALLAFVPKVAGFVALVRVLGYLPYSLTVGGELVQQPFGWAESPRSWALVLSSLLWILAAVTMTTGNVMALWQDNLKRLLAFSSVAHAGYMLIALAVAPHIRPGTSGLLLQAGSVDAILFYLVAYGAMTLGAFGVLSLLSTPERPVETTRDLEGLGRSRPGIALLFSLFLLSLIGIPLTAGFFGKALVFVTALSVPFTPGSADSAAVSRWFRILAIVGAVNAAIGGWYYLRLIATMYLVEPAAGTPAPARPRLSPLYVGVLACAVVTVVLGVYPGLLTDRAQRAAEGKVRVAVETPTADGRQAQR